MNLQKMITKAKQRFHDVQERVARSILIWLEKEPSQDRLLSSSGSVELYGPYIRYRSRGKRRYSDSDNLTQNQAEHSLRMR
jgi:hypothetical protein